MWRDHWQKLDKSESVVIHIFTWRPLCCSQLKYAGWRGTGGRLKMIATSALVEIYSPVCAIICGRKAKEGGRVMMEAGSMTERIIQSLEMETGCCAPVAPATLWPVCGSALHVCVHVCVWGYAATYAAGLFACTSAGILIMRKHST